MKSSLVGILFSLFASSAMMNVSGQAVSKPDSLNQVISGLKDSPEKADNLLALALYFHNLAKYDSAEVYCNKADTLSKILDYKRGMAECVFRRGLIQNKKTNYIAAIDYFRKYLDMIKPLNDNKGLVKGYYSLGTQLRLQGNFDSAMYCYHQSLSFSVLLLILSIL